MRRGGERTERITGANWAVMVTTASSPSRCFNFDDQDLFADVHSFP